MPTDTLQFMATAGGSALAAGAAVWWFLFRRELEPASEMTLDVDFAGRQDGQILMEVIATLANKSAVRQTYRDFLVRVRYLLPTDEVADGPKELQYQVIFPHSIDARIQAANESQRISRRFGYAIYINPRLTYRHSYITSIPEDATFIWVHCRLLFRTRERWYSMKATEHIKNQQRLFRVPDRAELKRGGVNAT